MLDQKNQSRVYAIENAQFVPYIFYVDGFLVPHSTSEGAGVIFHFSNPEKLLFPFFAFLFFEFLFVAQEIIPNFQVDHSLHLFPQSWNLCNRRGL